MESNNKFNMGNKKYLGELELSYILNKDFGNYPEGMIFTFHTFNFDGDKQFVSGRFIIDESQIRNNWDYFDIFDSINQV